LALSPEAKLLNILVADLDSEVHAFFEHAAERFGFLCHFAKDEQELANLANGNVPVDFCFLDWTQVASMLVTARKNHWPLVPMATAAQWSHLPPESTGNNLSFFLTKPLLPTDLLDLLELLVKTDSHFSEKRSLSPQEAFERLSGRILLVEDNEINREIVLTVFEDTSIVVDTAENGVLGFERYRENVNAYDLILMDVQMPEMDGLEATRRIRSSGLVGSRTVPIVALTANVFREDIEKCLNAGMNDHLGKPIDFDALSDVLQRYLPLLPEENA
jgi:CheY-like chemotaxis protein